MFVASSARHCRWGLGRLFVSTLGAAASASVDVSAMLCVYVCGQS